MPEYRFCDHRQRRRLQVEVPPQATVQEIISALVQEKKMGLPKIDDQGNPIEYSLSYDGHFLSPEATLAEIAPGSTIDIVNMSESVNGS